MVKKNRILQHFTTMAVAGVMATSAVVAQDTTQDDTSNPLTSQLSMGVTDDPNNQLGQPYAKEVNGDWQLRCVRTEVPENDPCQLYQLLLDSEGVPVAEFSLFRLPEGGQARAGATVVVPLETSLQDQLSIRVDEGVTKRYPFLFCNSIGCFARIGLTEEDVNAYKRGSAATISLVPARAPDQRISLILSLNGFTATFDKSSILDQ